MALEQTLHHRLKQERERLSWSQERVAEEIGSTRVTVSRWECGVTMPSFYFRQKLCALFQRKMEELFSVAVEASPPIMEEVVGLDISSERSLGQKEAENQPQKQMASPKQPNASQEKVLEEGSRSPLSLEVRKERLELHQKASGYTVDQMSRLISILDPECDATLRSLIIEQLLPQVEYDHLENEKVFSLPAIQLVKTALESARMERIYQREPFQERYSSLHVNGERVIQQTNSQALAVKRVVSRNPYTHTGPIRDSALFFGREVELRRLYASITNAQCVSLIGQSRIGKSSLLQNLGSKQIQQRLGMSEDLSKCILIYIDLGEFVSGTPKDFLGLVREQLIKQTQDICAVDIPRGDSFDLFSRLLDQIREQAFFPVLLLDEFDAIVRNIRFNASFFAFLRAQANYGRISYVTASRESLDRLSPGDHRDSPFFSAFGICPLGCLTEEEARELITIPGQVRGAFTEEEVQWVQQLAGRHPFFIQRVCYALYEMKYEYGHNGVGGVDLQRLQQSIYRDLSVHFGSIWKDLAPDQQRDLSYEAHRGNAAKRKIEELSESFLFRRYVCEAIQPETPITLKDLKEIVEHVNDHAFLQECMLAGMQYVAMRDDSTKNMRYQRGYLVQEFLKAAFELTKPSGVRGDTQNEWRAYNILYYRYFRHQMSHDAISARLGISRRQYFRDLDKAFQTLLERLLELDVESFSL